MESIRPLNALMRAMLSLGGGYVIAAVFASILALLLPLARADRVLLGAILSFPVYLLVLCIGYSSIRGGFRQSMNWLHTWSGLILSWVLYLIFVTGTASYYKDHISLWMTPEAQANDVPPNFLQLATRALEQQAPDAAHWVIDLPHQRNPALSIKWGESTLTSALSAPLIWDRSSGNFIPVRDTEGGEFLFRFHYRLHLPGSWGIWLVGLATLLLCAALVSGVVVHRRLLRDFFTFRPGKSPRRSWLDFHNLTGTLALPFHLMIAYTGLITLLSSYMPWPQKAVYGEETRLLFEESYVQSEPLPPGRQDGLLDNVTRLLEAEGRAWDDGNVERLFIDRSDGMPPLVESWPRYSGQISRFHSRTTLTEAHLDKPLAEVERYGPGVALRGGMVGLHLGHFANPWLRALFFLCGIAASGMIASGLVLWLRKRASRQQAGLGYQLVERMNLGILMGTPLAIASFFLANRLLPAAMPGRAGWEVQAFLWTLLVAVVHAFTRPLTSAWREQITMAALLFSAIPLANALLTSRGLPTSLATGDWLFAGFDLIMLVLGAVFGWMLLLLLSRERSLSQDEASDAMVRIG